MENLKTAFLHPGPEYSLVPFWFLNGPLEKQEIRRKLRNFKSKGVDGFVLHPRIGLPDDLVYMGETFMDFVRFIVAEAKALDMRVVLYDEGMYPSGSASGQVVQSDPAFAARGLRMVCHPARGSASVSETLAEYEKCELAAAVKRDADGSVRLESAVVLQAEGGAVRFTAPDADGWQVVLLISTYTFGTIRGIHFGEDDGEPGAPRAADLLNPAAVRRFIELTHEKYYAALKDDFGSTVRAVFTDEPDVLGRNVDKDKIKPWTDGFLDWYTGRGNAPADLLALFFDVGPDTASKRRAFDKAVNARLLETYYGQLSAWCAAHGVSLAGHPHEPGDIGLLKVFQIPGQDVVWRWVAPENDLGLTGSESTLAKCASDAARHRGARRNANECFGCCGPKGRQWEFTAGDMKWYMDWLFVRGANLLYPHAFLYSVEGEKRRDERPPDVGPNNAWWPYYGMFAAYARRMCWLLTDSVNTARTAVLCEEDRLPFRIVKPLYQTQLEFNYLEEQLLMDACTVQNGHISIQKQCYDTVLIEDAAILYPALTDKLEQFAAGGGTVLVCQPDGKAAPLAGAAVLTGWNEVAGATAHLREVVLAPACADIRMTHLQKGGRDFYLLVNEGEQAFEGTVSVRNTGRFERWDALRGTTEEIELTEEKDGISTFTFSLARRESAVLCVDGTQPPSFAAKSVPRRVETYDIGGGWSARLPGGGTARLDALVSWTEWDGLRHFSGTVVYEKALDRALLQKLRGRRAVLDCGAVGELAELTVNGQEAAVRLWAPYRFALELPDADEVTLRLAVTNSVANRISKAQVPSGLMGPVRIEAYQ